MKFTYLFIAVLLAGATSCSDDDWKKEVDNLKQPLPANIVLLSVPGEMVKGSTVDIVFRVNPSDALLTKEDLRLDCIRNEVYELELDDKTRSTRASYISEPACYHITEVRVDTNAGGEQLDGQYIASLTAETEANIFDVSELCLIIKGTSVKGEERLVSSEPFEVTMVPPIGEGVTVWHARNHSYRLLDTEADIIPSYISVDENTYRMKGTDHIKTYSLSKYLGEAAYLSESPETTDPETNPTGLFSVRDSLVEWGFLELIPTADEQWQTFGAEPFAKLDIPGKLELTDKFGTQYVQDVPLTYFNNTEEIPVEVELDYSISGAEFDTDLTEPMLQNGWDSDAIAAYRRKQKESAESFIDASYHTDFDLDTHILTLITLNDAPEPGETATLLCTLRVMPSSKKSFEDQMTNRFKCLNFMFRILTKVAGE